MLWYTLDDTLMRPPLPWSIVGWSRIWQQVVLTVAFTIKFFFFLGQVQPSSFRWCSIHWELWMHTQHSTASKPQTLPGCLRSHEQGIPKGFCVKFHRGVQCVPGCAFKHLCYKFEGPQKASQCNFRSQSKNTGKQSFLPSPNPQSLTLPTPINAERLVFLLSGRF